MPNAHGAFTLSLLCTVKVSVRPFPAGRISGGDGDIKRVAGDVGERQESVTCDSCKSTRLPHVAVGIAVQGGLAVELVDRHLVVFAIERILTIGHSVRVRCQHPAVAAGNDLVRVEGDDEVFAAPLQLAQAGTQFGDDGTPFAGRDDILVTSARLSKP